MFRTLRVFEHDKLPVTDHGNGIRPRELELLVRFNDQQMESTFTSGTDLRAHSSATRV